MSDIVNISDLNGEVKSVSTEYAAGVLAVISHIRHVLASQSPSAVLSLRACLGCKLMTTAAVERLLITCDMIHVPFSADRDYAEVDYLAGDYAVLPFGERAYWYRTPEFIKGLLWAEQHLEVCISDIIPAEIYHSSGRKVSTMTGIADNSQDAWISLIAQQADMDPDRLYYANDEIERFVDATEDDNEEF